jgi:glutathione S-transferase
MTLALYGHPFSSYTQKVLIALYENATPFEFREIGPDHMDHITEWVRRWPMGTFPMLLDGDRQILETPVIIEYLQLAHPGPVRLLPADPMDALDVRFMERFFDLHVMDSMQVAVNSALGRLPGMTAESGLALARQRLDRAYAWLDQHLAGKTWATGDAFTQADCAAAPFLFYADWIHRTDAHPALDAYRARLRARPSFARAVEEARYFRPNFPLPLKPRED